MTREFALSLMGASFGLIAATEAIPWLTAQTRSRFYVIFNVRNLIWFVTVVVVLLFGRLTERTFIISTLGASLLASVIFKVMRKKGPPALIPPSGHSPRTMSILIGLGAAMLYRNDVNVVRSAFLANPSFRSMHIFLVMYSAVSAFSGFVSVQAIYTVARTGKVPDRVVGAIMKWVVASIAASLAIALISLTISSSLTNYVLVGSALVVAVSNPFLGAILHSWRRSNWVYIVASGGFFVLVIAARSAPGLALYGYVTLTSLTLFGLIRHYRNRFLPA